MLLVTADLHLTSVPRDAYRHSFPKRLLALARSKQVEAILILGDLTEQKDEHNAWLVNQIVEHLTKLAEVCEVILLRGNHDYVADPSNAFFRFLRFIPNLVWIGRPEIHLFRTTEYLFLPHTNDYEKDWQDVQWTPLVFAHNTFTGADRGMGPPAEGIPATALPKGVEVVAGDIHIPQTFENITYVGSPYLVDFGDSFKPRVLLIDGEQKKSVPCPGPQKRLVEIGFWSWVMDKEEDRISRVCGDELNKGDILKVRVTMQKEDYAQWPEVKKQIQEWGEANEYEIFSIVPDVERTEVAKGSVQVRKPAKTDKELLKQYGRARTIDKDTLDVGMSFI
jgi:DNA repair exonuclease SbcCD nuclease subunit